MLYCTVCGKPTTTKHHLIFGNWKRQLCDADARNVPGLLIPLCNDCHTMGSKRLHDNPVAEQLSKMLGQALWENNYIERFGADETRQRFIERYGKSWL